MFSPTYMYVSMDVQFCKKESYFSKDISMTPLQGENSSKEEKKLG